LSEQKTNSAAIYLAPWVLPVEGPAIRDGAVAVKEGRIEAIGPENEVLAGFSDRDEIKCRGVLMPALINAHIHLELSHLEGIERPDAQGHICRWIDALIKARDENVLSADEKLQWRRKALAEQRRLGVVLMGDIGNEPCLPEKSDDELPLVHHFQEFLAPTKTSMAAAKAAAAVLPDTVSATVHACYSTLPELIILLKDRAKRLDRAFPVHVAESAEEIEFIATHSGPFRDFLEQRGAWDDSFSLTKRQGAGVVKYLQGLGILDARTLCVHCVHIKENEARLLFETGSHVCLCPGSNKFLRVGKAPLEMMLRCGLLPAIGTDSRTSNDCLDIWAEMQILREEHPAVDPKTIMAMATLGGANALNCQRNLGSLAPRKKAIFLKVESEEVSAANSALELYDILTRTGRPTVVDWVGNV
jgi:aminodeoxyfutalosine deaminase